MGCFKMVDTCKSLRRQLERKKRREFFLQLHEDQLLDVAFRGYTEEQKRLDEQVKAQMEWLNNAIKS